MANCSTKVWSPKAFFSNATKSKHDSDCGTSFDEQQCFDSKTILIKRHCHIFLILENLKQKIQNKDTKPYKYDSYDLGKKYYYMIIASITWHGLY